MPDRSANSDSAYAGLDYRTVQKAVTEYLRSAILSGRIGPGVRLQQDEISRQLGVSRMPVREALRILESEGLVKLRPHRGAVVVDLRPEDIAEIFEIRSLLEGHAAQLAAPHLTDATLARLRLITDEMARTTEEGHWLELNHQFHTALYLACGLPRLCSLIAAQRNAVQPYLRAAVTLLGRSTSAQEEHRQILQAAEERDPDALARCTVEHLRTTARGLIEYLERQRAAAAGGEGRPKTSTPLTGN